MILSLVGITHFVGHHTRELQGLIRAFLFIVVVIIQSYEAEADNEHVIKGNSAIMKCEIPSFVADFVAVDSWIDSNDQEYFREDNTST